MSTRQQPDRRSGSDRRGRVTPSSDGWLSEGVRMTRGLLLAVLLVVFSFFGFGAWAAVSTVRSLRQDDCIDRNLQRADQRELGHDLVDNDRLLINLADSLSEDGLPVEFTGPLRTRYDEQDAKIETAYAPDPCP